MRKTKFKIMGMLLSVLLVCGCLLPAKAVRADDPGTIKIQFSPNGTPVPNIEFHMIKIGEWDEDTGKYRIASPFKESDLTADTLAKFYSLPKNAILDTDTSTQGQGHNPAGTAVILQEFKALVDKYQQAGQTSSLIANSTSGTPLSVLTDKDGFATFTGVPQNALYIVASSSTYANSTQTETGPWEPDEDYNGNGKETYTESRTVKIDGKWYTETTTHTITHEKQTITHHDYRSTPVPFILPMPYEEMRNGKKVVNTTYSLTISTKFTTLDSPWYETNVRQTDVPEVTRTPIKGGGGNNPDPDPDPDPPTPTPPSPTPTPPTPTPAPTPPTPTPPDTTPPTPTFVAVDDDTVVAADIPPADLIRILDELVPLGSLDARTLSEYVPPEYEPIIRILSEMVPLAELESRILEDYVPEGGIVRILGELVPLAEVEEEIVPEDVPLASLPQTGLLWWPVPVMAFLGMAFCILGLAKKREQEYA